MKKATIRTVHPARLSSLEADQLVDQLYAVHQQIFAGVHKVDFVKYVLFPKALYTKIYLYENEEDQLVGYMAIHHFEQVINGQKILVARGENGVLAEYRSHWTNTFLMIKEGLRLKARYPFRICYYMGCFVYPVIYSIFARYAHEFYPNPGYETPSHIEAQMLKLADSFQLPQIDTTNALVRKVGWITRNSFACQHRLQASTRPSIQFYLRQNPEYSKGNGLVTLFPLSYKNVFLSIRNVFISKFKRRKKIQWGRIPLLSNLFSYLHQLTL